MAQRIGNIGPGIDLDNGCISEVTSMMIGFILKLIQPGFSGKPFDTNTNPLQIYFKLTKICCSVNSIVNRDVCLQNSPMYPSLKL